MIKKNLFLCRLIAAVTSITFSVNAQTRIQAKLNKATVYLNGAALTHTATATLKSGAQDICIEGLSPDIEIGSLKVSANGVLISAAEFSNDFIMKKEESARVKKMNDTLETYRRQLQDAKNDLAVNTHLLKILSDGTLNNMQGKDALVSTADITANMELYKAKAAGIQKNIDNDNRKITELNDQIKRLTQQLNQDMLQNKQRTGIVTLAATVPSGVTTTFTVTYFTPTASWTPCYDINIVSMDKPIAMQAKAQVKQTTGLDWNNVKLTLSNATPNRSKEAPVFSSWFLSFVRAHQLSKGYISARSNTITYAEEAAASQIVDGMQVKGGGAPLLMDDYVDVDEQEVYVNYEIAVPYNIAGNGKVQLIDLKSYDVKAKYFYYSIPKLSGETYLMATLSDYEKYNLLPGYATVTYNNTYVGKTFLRPNATEANLQLTLATEPRIAVKRELHRDYTSTKVVGNSTSVTKSYLITVKNNLSKAAQFTLKEQYPISNDKEIEVKLQEVSPSATYNKTETGVLTWELELKAGETRTFIVTFNVKYPKDRRVNL